MYYFSYLGYLNDPDSEHEPKAMHEARKMYKSCVTSSKFPF